MSTNYKILGKRVLLQSSITGKFNAKDAKFTPDKKKGFHQAKVIQLGNEVPEDFPVKVGDLVEVDKTPGVIDILEQDKKGKKGTKGTLVETWSVRFEDITAIIESTDDE